MTTECRGRPPAWAAALAAAAVAALCAALLAQEKTVHRPIVIIGGTLVDGSGAPSRRNDAIVVQEGRVKMMGLSASRRAPKDARMIDASSKWILPGLIDAAVHLTQTGGADARPDLVPTERGYQAVLEEIERKPAPYLRAYVCSGVTSVLDIGGSGWTFELRAGREDDELAPRISTTGPRIARRAPAMFQVPGNEAYLVPGEKEALPALVARLATQAPTLVAVSLDPVAGEASADAGLLRGVVAEARPRKLRVIAEVATAAQLEAAVDAGVDAVVLRVGEELPGAVVTRLVERKIAVVPPLAAADAGRQLTSGAVRVEEFEKRCAPASSLESITAPIAWPSGASRIRLGAALEGEVANVRRLAAAGATIVAGSGAGEPRALHGTSLLRELELLVEAGLTPLQAMTAATRDAAMLLGRPSQVGQVKEGMAGDLLLLDADPTADIRNLSRVVMTIRGGAIYER